MKAVFPRNCFAIKSISIGTYSGQPGHIFGEDRVLGKSYTFLEDGNINENFYVDAEGALVPVSPVGQATPSGGMPPLVK